MATPGVDPNWPEPLGRRVSDIFSRPLALALAGTWEVMNETALHWLPVGLGFAFLYCGAVFLRARQRDLLDVEAEKPAVQIVCKTWGPWMLIAPTYEPSGPLMRDLPIQTNGAECMLQVHVLHARARTARLVLEGRVTALDGSEIRVRHALWAPEDQSIASGEEYLTLRDLEEKRMRIFLYIGHDDLKASGETPSRVRLFVRDILRPGDWPAVEIKTPGTTEV